SPAVCAV
ncbi:hypothetical protein BN1723_020410, partial [Verticillium longisporum]